MEIPPSIKPLLHKKPLSLGVVTLIMAILFISDTEGNIEKLPLVGDLLGFAWHIIIATRFGILVFVLTGFVLIWFAVKKRLELPEYYQPRPRASSGELSIEVHDMLIRAGGPNPIFEFTTFNQKNTPLESDRPIQSARFTKPVERIVRPNSLPAVVPCEPRLILRLRNRCLGHPEPRIIVKRFTENGIIFDAENTKGVEVTVELYNRASPSNSPK